MTVQPDRSQHPEDPGLPRRPLPDHSLPADSPASPGQPAHPVPGPLPGAEEAPWRRVHPASPLVRGWIGLLAVAWIWGQNWLEDIILAVEDPGGYGAPPMEGMPFIGGVAWLLMIGGAVLLLVGLAFFLSWRFTKYQVTDQHVNVNSGVVFRRQRQARIDRVQAIDIVQPLLARIFGLAELKFEVADAGQTAMSLAFLRLGEAKRLRNLILARAAGLRPGQAGPAGTAAPAPSGPAASAPGAGFPGIDVFGPAASGTAGAPSVPEPAAGVVPAADAPEAPERVVAAVPVGRLVGSLIFRPITVSVAVLILGGLALRPVLDGRTISPLVVLPFLLGAAGALWSGFSNGFNFQAAASPDGLRMGYGLLDTRHQTVPPGRVQAVEIRRPLLWRPFGWYRVTVNVAGYGPGGNGNEARSTVLPVGTFADVLGVLSVVLPDPGTSRPLELVTAGIDGSGDAEGFRTTPRRARALAPLAWRRQGFALTDTALFARTGVLGRALAIVPHERTQGIALQQGPLARRFGVCDVRLATTAGPVSPRVVQADVETARILFLEQADRAAKARHRHDRDHWLEEDPHG
ncbi:PH domain-containing protein [Arthrobacter ginkgonis]|uniref:PH domain-containing protein n=1 Tax=Arthrobacter ginkgonis TaxID=1630594 RepID=A0ABP7CYY5_9MICC